MLYLAPIATTDTTFCFSPGGCPPPDNGPSGIEVFFAVFLLIYGLVSILFPTLVFDLTHLFGYAEPPKPSKGRIALIRVTGVTCIAIAGAIIRAALIA